MLEMCTFFLLAPIGLGYNLILIFYGFNLFLIMDKKKISFIVPKTLPKTETVVSEDKSEIDKNKGWTKYYRVNKS